jgi:alpha-1,3-rhamnosyl/mannosyltransferase
VQGVLGGLRRLAPADLTVMELAWPVDNFGYRQPARALKTAYREWIWSRLVAPRTIARMQADILHRGTPSLPIEKPAGVREVVTLHDLAILRHPERYRRWQRFSEPRRLHLLNRADRVICVSQFTAHEAMALLGLPATKLEIVYQGSDMAKEFPADGDGLKGLALPDRFFLFVGSLEPGKNLGLLREAYALAGDGKDLLPLVIAGARWPGVPTEGGDGRNWTYLGYQPDHVLAALYRRAVALVFPSKYEGFGLPVLEAMSLGCPVVCSRVASLPEVGEDAVCWADLTPAAYADAMRLLATDAVAREQYSRAGILQATKFSWDSCIARVLGIYRSLL